MGSFFNLDSPIMRFLGRMADIMILNIIFLISCIPIVTIGAAWTALSYVTLKMVRDEESYIVKSYFKSFRQNFRQATVIWVISLIAMLIFYMDFHILKGMEQTMSSVMFILLSAMAVLFFMTEVYVFPVLSKFENTIKNTVKNAFLMALSNLPRTIVIVAVIVGSVVLTFLSVQAMAVGMLIWIMIGFALIAFLNANFFVKIFDRYIPEEEEEDKNLAIDTSVFSNLHPSVEKEEANPEEK